MTAQAPTRVVILGGGFGGLVAAERFERKMPKDGSVEVRLVSRDNYLLYTPMLAEVATGQINPFHIAAPLRVFLRRVRVTQAVVTGIDLQRRIVSIYYSATQEADERPFDQLVLALGSETSYHHTAGAETYAYPFKHLADAARIRDRVLDCFEQAAHEDNPAHRQALLTFVVAGGGFSGVELAAALADFMRDIRKFYPRLAGTKLHLVLAHHGHRLLEELNEASAAYTLRLLKQEGIAVRLNTSVTRVTEDSVELEPGGTIPTRTVCWTAGVAPSSLVASLDVPKDRHGAVVVDGHLAVQGHPGVWAIGDCASIPNPRDGGTYAPLAQNAEREGPVVADNVLATLRGDPLKTFDYRLLGTFASLGQRTAVGQVFGRQYSGLHAWFLWRGVYLSKLPGWDRKIRVGIDWLLDFVLQPDVVNMHTDDRGPGNPSPPAPPASDARPATAAQPSDGSPTPTGPSATGSATAAPAGSAGGAGPAATSAAPPSGADDTTQSSTAPTPGA